MLCQLSDCCEKVDSLQDMEKRSGTIIQRLKEQLAAAQNGKSGADLELEACQEQIQVTSVPYPSSAEHQTDPCRLETKQATQEVSAHSTLFNMAQSCDYDAWRAEAL